MNLWWLLLAYAWGGPALVPVRTVSYDFELGGIYFDALFLEKDTFVAQFQMDDPFYAAPGQPIKPLRPRGLGPGDLDGVFAFHQEEGRLWVITESGRMKSFERDATSGYEPKGEVHFQDPSRKIVFVHDGVRVAGKWVVAGFGSNFSGPKMDLVNIFNADGTFYRNAVPLEPDEAGGRQVFYEESFLVALDEDRVLYLREDQLKATLFRVHDEGLETHRLSLPPGYVPIGDETFRRPPKKRPKSISGIINQWRMGYSSVANVLKAGRYLVVQVRTPGRGTLFQTQFYDLATMEPAFHHAGNDFLLGAFGSELYFYENGMPGADEEAGPMRLRVFVLAEG